MELSDVCGASYGERMIGFSAQIMKPSELTQSGIDLAHQMTVEEMMNEQHAMLMAICEKLGIPVG